jgi:uncharacterized membrane protein YjjP (DUF1212 family)
MLPAHWCQLACAAGGILAQHGDRDMCIKDVLNRLAQRQGLDAIHTIPRKGSAIIGQS